jgi:hypothetical protein
LIKNAAFASDDTGKHGRPLTAQAPATVLGRATMRKSEPSLATSSNSNR